jgi:uncharacterized protein (TIGR02453 family)
MSASFPGFPADAVDFLRELDANNRRDWFTANKSRYEQSLKAPAEGFAAQLGERLALLSGFEQQAKVYRIYRDVRFSKDKRPYKPWLHIGFTALRNAGPTAGWFFALEKDGQKFGAGSFMFDKPGLERFRQRLDSPAGTRFDEVMQGLRANGIRVGEPELKRVPRGYPADHPCAEWLRYKGISVWVDETDTAPLLGPGALDHCIAQFTRLKPFYDWLLTD